MKPTPPGWPRISASLYYQEAAKAIDWLCQAFGFEVRLKIEGDAGRIEHSELTFGEDGLIMVSEANRGQRYPYRRAPSTIQGVNTMSLMVYVDDVEAHCKKARAAGAKIVAEPTTQDYGEEYWSDRGYECEDLEGHHWWFYQRLRTGAPKA
ncbi:MAG TPA: VOC family protein [Polyangiaceae bacterium]